MDRQEFLKQQYITLREEIRETKDRIFKTMSFGLIIVPGSNFLAHTYQLDTVLVSLPILVMVVALLYLSEENSLMRCGRYIKHYIEPTISDTIGWEQWLEGKTRGSSRDVDTYLSYAFYLLFAVYFFGTVFVAGRFTVNTWGVVPGAIVLGLYTAMGVWFVIYLIYSLRLSTGDDSPKGI